MGQDFQKGIRDGIPIALGYLSVSFTFGLAAVANGLAVWQAVLISLTNLTSAGQFAGLDIMAAAGGYAEMVLAQLVINLRYSLMSIAVSQKADANMKTPQRLLVGFGITDEIFAVATGQNDSVSTAYMTGLMLTPIAGWTLGTLLGALAGNILPALVADALGIAIYGMFLAIILPPARENKKLFVIIGAAAAISCIRYFTPLREVLSSGFTIIIAALAASVLGAVLFPVDTDAQKEEGSA
ncbi:MAG: AzlC family ABC transporter permease [Oscillospiraceae bacterium]|nr:AzlC family ABC transporter permease [Oscillospiraceae bacterium]MBR1458712.1 AzlC family ABC transporter permease [Oscillospiraceae bacterium]